MLCYANNRTKFLDNLKSLWSWRLQKWKREYNISKKSISRTDKRTRYQRMRETKLFSEHWQYNFKSVELKAF